MHSPPVHSKGLTLVSPIGRQTKIVSYHQPSKNTKYNDNSSNSTFFMSNMAFGDFMMKANFASNMKQFRAKGNPFTPPFSFLLVLTEELREFP